MDNNDEAKNNRLNKFELKTRDCLGRIGLFHTVHGDIETPTLLPVINPNEILIQPAEMQTLFGTQAVITNSYIIHKHQNLADNARDKGLHSLLDFDGPIMTDSGTFQTHVYGKLDIDPVEIIKFQIEIGTDIGTILDVFTEPSHSLEEAQENVKVTLERAKESVQIVQEHSESKMALAGTIQGGVHLDQRTYCAEQLSALDYQVHPIGGVVPLMEAYRYRELVDIVLASKKGLTPARPVHLFGAGHPMLFPLAVALGCDLFDSASYSKYAHKNRLMFPDGTRRLEDLEFSPCNCPVCNKYSVSELKSLDNKDRILELAKHNLYVCFSELEGVKQAIHDGSLWELVEQRARSHPYLLQALAPLRERDNKIFIEKYEPLSRKRFLYLGTHSLHRPDAYRYETRFFKRYRQPTQEVLVGFDMPSDPENTYSQHYQDDIQQVLKMVDANFMVASIFGPVPLELDEMYPVGQAVTPSGPELNSVPELDKRIRKLMEKFSHGHKYGLAVMWDGKETLELLEFGSVSKKQQSANYFDLQRVRAVANMQFGYEAGELLFKNEAKVKMVKSKKTGKIRNVILDDEHILSLRAQDGLFTLKAQGAKVLHKQLKPPALRVIVDKDSEEFNRDGKNVFAKFVIDCDPEIRPMDEVLVVNENDELVAVGRALMNRQEMLAFNIGLAVKVREGIK